MENQYRFSKSFYEREKERPQNMHNPFMVFYRDFRKRNRHLNQDQVQRIAMELWENMTEYQRARYMEMSRVLAKRRPRKPLNKEKSQQHKGKKSNKQSQKPVKRGRPRVRRTRNHKRNRRSSSDDNNYRYKHKKENYSSRYYY